MIKLELTAPELDVIMKYLGMGAFNEVAPIVAKIHGQAIPQIQDKNNENSPAENS
jgi:hypothetical protein